MDFTNPHKPRTLGTSGIGFWSCSVSGIPHAGAGLSPWFSPKGLVDLKVVGVSGFEPPASWLQTKPSTRLTLHPVEIWW